MGPLSGTGHCEIGAERRGVNLAAKERISLSGHDAIEASKTPASAGHPS